MKRFFALTSVFALTLAACQPATPTGDHLEDTDEPIKIGYIGALTGDSASSGVDALNGATLAVQEINAAGGVNGRMIEFIVEDGKCTGTDAASAAQKLVHIDKVVAIIGGQCSGETLAAAPIAEAAEVVMVSPVSSSPDVTDAGDFIFRDYPSDALKTKAAARYFKKEGIKKVAIITENTDFAVGFRDSLREDVGDVIVFDELVEPGTKDYRSLMTRLKDVEFDAFIPNGQSTATMAAMMQQLREQGLTQRAISHDVAQNVSMIEIAADAVEGMQAIGLPNVSDDSEFGKKFLAEFGEIQAGLLFGAQAYDAMHIVADAIESVGTDGAAIRDYLYDLDVYDGVAGEFSFDSNGDVVGISFVLWQVVGGVFVQGEAVPVE